ncbi:MAG TPA: adenylate/guanylate cyclase domain-containing protein, partial [Methylomirabilota bacterium]|nr:adenylate/guanylate cyclase domain-containing protein [Methylomirabilota bacterium]
MALRFWQRLGVRLAALFATVTLLAVGLVGVLTYERQKSEVQDTVGAQLLNIARTAVLLVDSELHAEAQRTGDTTSPAYRRIQEALAAIQERVVVPTPVITLADYDPAARRARLVVTSQGPARPGDPYVVAAEVVQPMSWTFDDGFARFTPIYRDHRGVWISAFAAIKDGQDRTTAVLMVDYPVEVYLDRLGELRATILIASAAGTLGALVLGLLFARHATRPISALTAGVGRVAAGDLSRTLPVRSSDEVGQLTRAFNAMLEGLRQRDFIRATFGRYVSPEVAQTLLASPEALRLGGTKREVTILMSDLRGYTRFAEHGDPAEVMAILNVCLGRLSEVIIAYGGTINEFIGDAIFAIFGAPLDHPDHAERAAAAALAMQRAMAELNEAQAARGLPRFEMGIGINTGEAVVGNIGSEHRAKYGVVGNAVNTAARIEGATVGGQIFVSATTYECIRDIAEVGSPVAVAVKGLSEPLPLYELRALGGRFDLRLPETADETGPLAEVALPLACWVIEGKTVGTDVLAGTAVRLGRRRLVARLDVTLSPLTNVRLRLTYAVLGHES